MAKLVSKTYGEALYEVAVAANKTSELLDEIRVVREILKENPEFGSLMLHPGIAKQEKIKVLETTFKGRVSDELTGFLVLVIENERYKEVDSVFTFYEDKVKADQGIGVAYVTTPKPLDEATKKTVEDKLLETTDFKKMEMHFITDEALIGGMIIRIGDRVVDSSIRSKLDDLTKQLFEIQLG